MIRLCTTMVLIGAAGQSCNLDNDAVSTGFYEVCSFNKASSIQPRRQRQAYGGIMRKWRLQLAGYQHDFFPSQIFLLRIPQKEPPHHVLLSSSSDI
ncbi:hypothetical protein Tco_0211258 [Tanacetum coccineum]